MATFTRAQSGADANARQQPSTTSAASGAVATTSPQPASTSTVVSGAVQRDSPQATETPVGTEVTARGLPNRAEAFASAEVVAFGTPGSKYRADRLRPFEMGLFLPDSFRDVPVEIVDQNGDRITDTIWVLTSHAFGTASKVEDGLGTVTMVAGLGYEQFIGIGDRAGTDEVDYAWYSVDDEQETINPPVYERKTIVLKPAKIKGLWTGGGFDKKGQLG